MINVMDANRRDLPSVRISDRERILNESLLQPNFLTLDLHNQQIEVKPGRFSAISIDLKATWHNPFLVKKTIDELKALCLDCHYIVGIETGGSPYATSIALNLGVGLSLARVASNNDLERITGNVGLVKGPVAIVDDVLASGLTASNLVRELKKIGHGVVLVCVISYGLDDLIAKKYRVDVRSLFQIEDLMDRMDKESRALISPHLSQFQDALRKAYFG